MPLTEADWANIYSAIQKTILPSEIVVGRVVKRHEKKKLVWLKEFGDVPIPIVGFNSHVKVLDKVGATTVVRKLKVVHDVPKVGQMAVVLRQYGSRRLPKCIGIILSTGSYAE